MESAVEGRSRSNFGGDWAPNVTEVMRCVDGREEMMWYQWPIATIITTLCYACSVMWPCSRLPMFSASQRYYSHSHRFKKNRNGRTIIGLYLFSSRPSLHKFIPLASLLIPDFLRLLSESSWPPKYLFQNFESLLTCMLTIFRNTLIYFNWT